MLRNKKPIIILFFCLFLLLIVSVSAIFYYTLEQDKAHSSLEKAIKRQHRAILLADQLRQSSDDLTRMVRSYAVTGEEKYKEAFYQILDIRAGKAKRPLRYGQIYWDFKLVDPEYGKDAVELASLESLMAPLGLTPAEKQLLAKAESRSNDLAKLEEISIHAMQGLFRDNEGQFTVTAEPDRRLARQILFSPGYFEAKREIMTPINQFMIMLDKRTSQEVEAAQAEIDQNLKWQSLFSYLLILCAPLIFVLSIRYQKISASGLVESEERFKSLSEASYGGVIIHDQGKILDCNQGLADMTGFTMNELVDMDGLKLIAPGSLDKVLHNIRSGYDQRYEVEGVRKDGTVYPLSIQGKNIQYKGETVRVIEFRDITEIKEVENKLKRSEAEHRAMIENIHDVIAIIDRNGINQFKSQNISKWFGWQPEDVIGRSTWENVHAEDVESTQAIFAKMIEEPGKINTGECRYRCLDGTYRWIEFTAVNCLNNPLIEGILLTYRDISERKKMFREQRRSAQLAALGTVAAGVAHEINNPIQGIMNLATLIERNPENTDRIIDCSARIIAESKRIASLTKDLLYYSKDDSSQLIVSDIEELISGALGLITSKLNGKGVFVETSYAENLPHIAVQPQGLQQVIINLVDNAFDAICDKALSDNNKVIRIDVEVTKLKQEPYLLIEVHDQGTGMTSDVIERAKEAFFSTKPSRQGTGLGLSIVNDIVASHNGFLDIESRPGEYTKISVYLPTEQNKH